MKRQHKHVPKSLRRVLCLVMISLLVYMSMPTVGFADTFSARIMQGNTISESDCREIVTGLYNSGSYTPDTIRTDGWQWLSPTYSQILTNRATPQNFFDSGNVDYAYFSGHGSHTSPTLNPNAGADSYGNYTSFNVGTLLHVTGSDWRTSCDWRYSRIKVLMLAACYQLDKTYGNALAYARIMRASNIRAIAGFHESAPGGDIDRQEAQNFMSYANAGNSVRFSWEMACSAHGYVSPWAVLVYRENSNEYYRIPGFPGNQYAAPSSDAIVYRYRQGLSGSEIILNPAAAMATTSQPPLYITATSVPTAKVSFMNREPVDPESDLPLETSHSVSEQFIRKVLTDSQYQNTICITTPVIRDEVSTEYEDFCKDTDVVVERLFTYYNSCCNVRLNDAFVNISVDKEGVGRVLNDWKEVVGPSTSLNATTSIIDKTTALSFVQKDPKSNGELRRCDLVYDPIGNDTYKLKYEVVLDGGTILYVDAENGSIEQKTLS